MDKKLRIEKLQKIKTGNSSIGKTIRYKNETRDMPAHSIPIEYLIFNQYNARIGTHVKTYEKENGPLDATTPEGESIISKFLWDSKKSRNQGSYNDILSKGQLEVGIVTKDGVVIDGNRRCMILKKISKENPSNTQFNPTYFRAVILDDSIEDNPKEIRKLETIYQMGVDEKVDYNPIEKYLKCRDLEEGGFTTEEIAGMMGQTKPEIAEYLEILVLLDEYLEFFQYDGMYSYLDKAELEGPFHDLRNHLSKHRKNPQGRDWTPEEDDLDDLKQMYFNFARAGFKSLTQPSIRSIGNPAKGKGIFSTKKIWEDFKSKYNEEIEPKNLNEKPLEEYRKENSEVQLIDLINSRNAEWKGTVHDSMTNVLYHTTRQVEDHNSEKTPFELLKRAKNTLEQIDPEIDSFEGEEIKGISHKIRKLVEGFVKTIEQKDKSK